MADIKQLADKLKELDDLLTRCMRCGMCQAQCPVFARTGRETDVTRGKLALISGLGRKMLSDPEQVKERLERCLLCGTCQVNCPSGVQVSDIFLRARAIINGYLGLSRSEKIIFRSLLTHPGLMNRLVSFGALFQGLLSKEADSTIGTSCARFNVPLSKERHFKKLAAKPLHKQVKSLDSSTGSSGLRVAFFPGCITDKIFPETGLAALKIFKHHEVGVYMPEGQACCGIPALSAGDSKAFSSLVSMNVQLFSSTQWDYLITPCATCTSTIRNLWPEFHNGDLGMVRPEKVMDATQFLMDVLGVEPADIQENQKKIAYHDPCHLRNSLKITTQPRSIISAAKGNAVVELPGGPSCCGSGGSFNIKHYELSADIGRQKARDIAASGAQVAATACPACMLQLSDMLSKENISIPVKHVLEIYAQSL
ncbi:(Fe-S)-binding protein [Desulfonatronovibrio magnus]|uniref:(Fe-S)-binding protein n=1 Tax=Desulfonatronovibrio magnus TaxID=698827 RepID=UPI0005EAD452|nr:(Fe-S)-binding protein [Desulfonatronovibrio magnus]